MSRILIVIALLALTPLPGTAETATLQFATEAIDLETGTVVEVIAGLPASLEADFHFAYHAGRTPHAVLFPNGISEVEISFLDDTPFNLISEVDIPLLTFSLEFPDQPFESGDTAVLKTDTGAYYKVGNAVEDELSVQFDYELLTEQLASIDSLQTAPRPPLASPSALASSLHPADWQAIRSLLERNRYLIADLGWNDKELEKVPTAENPAHRLQATFAPEFVRVASLDTDRDPWTWSLALEGYGYGETLRTPESPDIVTSGNRVEYRRGELTEWYVNDERGLEQGFTLAEAPPGQGKQSLRICLDLGGSLATEPGAKDGEILLAEAGSEHRLRYGGLVAWDAAGRDLPARMVLDGKTLTLEVDDRAAVYPVTVDPTIYLTKKLLASDGAAGHFFGHAVSVSGDTVVVGARQARGGGIWGAGAAYVFVKENDDWIQQTKLVAEDASVADFFGYSVSLSGDMVAIGAPGADSVSYTDTGAVYVFVRSDGTWSQQQKILGPVVQYGRAFGYSVSLSGDTILVGTPSYAKYFQGRAYAYVLESGTWIQQHDFPYRSNILFGGAVSLSGDTAIIGHQGGLNVSNCPAHVYVRTGTTWSWQTDLTGTPLPYPYNYHAYAVAVSGDTALVGAPYVGCDDGGYCGRAYVFVRDSGVWSQQATLLPSDGGLARSYFGSALSISGDTAIIGRSGDPEQDRKGAAYLFTRDAAGWTESAELLAGDGALGDNFGNSLEISGSMVVIGAHRDDDLGTWSGSAWVFGLPTNQPPICSSPVSVDAECDGPTTSVTGLDGSYSSDPDDDPLSFSWTSDCPGWVFDDATSVTPELTLDSTAGVCEPLSCTATLTVSDDDGESDTCDATTVEVEDTLPPIITPEASPSPLECGVDTYVEAGATATDVCDGNVPVAIGGDTVDTGVVGSYTRTYDAADACGNVAAQATRTVSVVDALPPTLVVPEPTEITVTDTDCSGDEAASISVASATDACDPSVLVSHDAPETFPAGATTTVTYTAVDASGNPSSAAVEVTVLFGADITIRARQHSVGPGTYPGANKEPLVGIEVCGYDKAEGGCARTTCGGISHHQYQCILDSCAPVNAGFNEACCTTDAAGECTINGPPAEYLFISTDPTGTTLPDPLGGVGELTCGESKKKFLQLIVRADGKKMPGKTTIRTGSELLIIEPEFVEWEEAQEAYPVVFDSVGEWSAEAAVAPPEGFVSDYETLSEQVDNELEAVQFVLTDLGSDWVPTQTRYTIEHRGRSEVVLSRIGVRLSASLAAAKGLHRDGYPLDAGGQPVWHGFDPRGEWPAEIAGWIEPASGGSALTVKLRVSVPSELELSITRGENHLIETLVAGSLSPGEYAFDWDSDGFGPGAYFVRLITGDLTQKVKLAEKP